MQRTGIEWVLNPDGSRGFTSNPVKGYCPVVCSYCYSRADYDRFGWDKTIRFDDQELAAIGRRRKPAGIFVGSMFELFLKKYLSWTELIMETIRLCPQHRIYLLTKRPEIMALLSPFPENCRVGVTATGPLMFYNALDNLRQIEASVKYISIEPLLEEIKIPDSVCLSNINQLIIGAQTKNLSVPYRAPKMEWVKEIMDVAMAAGIPVFLKNNMLKAIQAEQNWSLTKDMVIERIPGTGIITQIRQEVPA